MTRFMKLVDSKKVRVCGDDSPAAKSVRSEEQLFSLISSRVSPEFLSAVLHDIDDFIDSPHAAQPMRSAAWLSQAAKNTELEPPE